MHEGHDGAYLQSQNTQGYTMKVERSSLCCSRLQVKTQLVTSKVARTIFTLHSRLLSALHKPIK